MSKLEEIEKQRAERKAKLQAQADDQRAVDVEALNACEEKHGDTSVCRVDVPYTPGLPTMAIARLPKPIELKRYREKLKVNGEKVDVQAATEAAAELGGAVRIYPEKDVFDLMCAARPDLASQLGSRATKLAQGKAAEEGKE